VQKTAQLDEFNRNAFLGKGALDPKAPSKKRATKTAGEGFLCVDLNLRQLSGHTHCRGT
jgi:hypothetical protein